MKRSFLWVIFAFVLFAGFVFRDRLAIVASIITVLLSPLDFRRKGHTELLPKEFGWTADLYSSIRERLKDLPLD